MIDHICDVAHDNSLVVVLVGLFGAIFAIDTIVNASLLRNTVRKIE